jgi:capsular polysaccharide biosynthesis protein
MEETISLREILETLKKRLGLIIAITVLAALTSGIVSFFVLTPVYQSSTQLLVNQSKTEQSPFDASDIQTNLELINTYNVIMKSPVILEKVSDNLNLNMTADKLNSKITVGSENNSQVVKVSVTDPDPEQAASIANEVASVFQEEIPEIMNVDNVSILSPAATGEKQSPVKPKPVLNIAIAIVVGLMAGVGLAFLLEYFDNTLKSEQDIDRALGLPILGSVTTMEGIPAGPRQGSTRRSVRGETNV